MTKRFGLKSLVVSGVAAAQFAVAQGGAAPALEVVVVTAQKMEQSIQDVPISIAALDELALERHGVNSVTDIRMLVPSLTVRPNPVSDQNLQFTLRGVAAGAIELTQDLTAAVHLNGVYIARGNGLNLSVADLERVEVLRGPQGTLYGRNATAGAINYITRKPTDEFEFRQQFTAGNYDKFLSKTTVNVPVSDTLALRASYLIDDKEGWISNSYPGGSPINDRDADAARFDLRWQPTENLTLDYGYDWSRSEYYSQPLQCTTLIPGLGSLVDPATCSPDDRLDDLSLRGKFTGNEVWARGHTFTVDWSYADDHTLRAIIGYREYEDDYQGMLLAGGERLTAASGLDTTDEFAAIPPFQFPQSFIHTEGDYTSIELQFIGAFNETLAYNAGLYWFDEEGRETGERGTQLVVWPAPDSPILPTGFVSPSGVRDLDASNESEAAYLQLTWSPAALDGRLDIVPGIRYTRDDRQASLYNVVSGASVNDPAFRFTGEAPPASGDIGDVGVPAEYEDDFSEVTPSLVVQYHLDHAIMVYGKYVEGYRSGGTAIRATPIPDNRIFKEGFDPETLTSLEAGIKADFLDSRLRVNANVYISEFEDQQVTVRNSSPEFADLASVPFDIFNVGESTYTGTELDVNLALSTNLRLDISHAYIEYEYDSVKDPETGVEIKEFFHFEPARHSASVTLAYREDQFQIGNFTGVLDASLSWSYEDRYASSYVDSYSVVTTPGPNFGEVTPGPEIDRSTYRNPAFDLVNARVSLTELALLGDGGGKFGMALWVKNLADEEYSLMTNPILAPVTPAQRYWGEPRTYGIDLIYEF
jgi:iron complex outermembrane receptor protein